MAMWEGGNLDDGLSRDIIQGGSKGKLGSRVKKERRVMKEERKP